MSPDPESLFWLMRSVAIDRVSAEVVTRFEQEGIDAMLVKGPVIEAWLFQGEVRGYTDSDLLVPAGSWERAVDTLRDLGFSDFLGPLAHPRMESRAGTGFLRGADNVDLHGTLPGFEAEPMTVWRTLRPRSTTMEVGGRQIPVPDRATVLAHIALHAANDVDGKPLDDLGRALRTASAEEWRAAADLAAELDGLAAFASGVRLGDGGDEVLRSLGLDRTGSIHFDLRASKVPLAEGMDELLAPGLTLVERAAILRRELLPKPEFMRWWSPLARRGRRGLVASYPTRWLWLASKAPDALATRRRVRGARR